jgi:hypothetical protein
MDEKGILFFYCIVLFRVDTVLIPPSLFISELSFFFPSAAGRKPPGVSSRSDRRPSGLPSDHPTLHWV